MPRRRTIARLVLVLAVGPLAASGCSDDGSGDPAEESFPNDTTDDRVFAFTPTITITPTGFVPEKATAVFGETLTFVNETTEEQTITFANGSPAVGGPQTLGPIPPGGSMSWPEPLSVAISLVYESEAVPGVTGRLQIDPGADQL